MGFYDSTEANAAQERAWGGDAIPEHILLRALLFSLAAEDDGGDALDAARDAAIDDAACVRDWIKAAAAGDEAEAGRMVRNFVERHARLTVGRRS